MALLFPGRPHALSAIAVGTVNVYRINSVLFERVVGSAADIIGRDAAALNWYKALKA